MAKLFNLETLEVVHVRHLEVGDKVGLKLDGNYWIVLVVPGVETRTKLVRVKNITEDHAGV